MKSGRRCAGPPGKTDVGKTPMRRAGRDLSRWICAVTTLLAGLADLPAHAQESRPAPALGVPTIDGPLTPDQAPRSFRLEPGLRVELVASEPMIQSPVAIVFDERGRLYVAENRGYPTGPGPNEPPLGRVARLEDTDGDGVMDRRVEFAEGLTYPNGLMPWKDGLIVTCAPDVLFLRDTDGDGKADERTVWFTGFATTGSTQLRVSHPTLGIDNWIYLTSGLTGGKVVAKAFAERPPVELKRTDFRFRPDGSDWEGIDGGAQFGLTFDDFGRRFICYNRVQVQHVVINTKVLRRNPHLAFSDTVQNCPAEMVAEPLKGHGSAARLYPISRNVTTADSHAGTFTAACGVTVFRGTGLPEAYRDCVFSCDPTGNLVHVDQLEPNGATFSAKRLRDGIEFLSSSDNWFRPVFLTHGPDGALYIVDMYRKTIEHPDYLPVEIRKRTDFNSGKTMGRIWRVVSSELNPAELRARRSFALADRPTPELCEVLREADFWRRSTAHRLLLTRGDKTAQEALHAIAEDNSASPESVVHALRLLEALDELREVDLRRAITHRSAGVREQALQMIEPRLARESAFVPFVVACADDRDPRVRFQAAITLGAVTSNMRDLVSVPLARIAARDGSDRWLRAAVFSSLSGIETAFLTELGKTPRDEGRPLPTDLLTELGRLLGSSVAKEEWPNLVRKVLQDRPGYRSEEQAALMTGLAESARGRVGPAGGGDVLTATLGTTGEIEGLRASLKGLLTAMAELARDDSASIPRRTAAIGLLGFASYEDVGAELLGLIDGHAPREIQVAAVRALGAHRDERVATVLLASERFNAYSPSIREEVLSALLSQGQHVPGLLNAIEDGRVPAIAIDALRRRQLTQSRDAAIRKRAEAIFGAVQGDRAKVYEEFKGVVDLEPNPSNGRVVFRRECASCHRLDREGSAVGPDLFGIRNQPKAAILLHVLVPDQEITQGFTAYNVATKDGRVLTGLITSESPTSITLRQPLGKEDTILRDEIDELSAGKQSLMPQGLEKNISRQEFADLLAYLKGEDQSDH